MATVKKAAASKTASRKRSAPETKPSASDEVDQQLARYRSMRDFKITAEPGGGDKAKKSNEALPFVVQKHAATRLHYDFRLGWRGVLKSWAVTKGPSYVTADKRLAVQVEDHPMEYGGFEGTIPKGQYGGGTVMLWDQGTWEPQPGIDVDASLKAGNLKFILHGEKLEGKWALIRMGGKAAQESKPNWLLIKEHDDFERGASDPQITEEKPNSVLTRRDLEAIAQQQDHVWQSKPAHGAERKMSAEARLRERLQQKAGTAPAAPSAPRQSAALTSGAKRHMRASRTASTKSDPAPGFISPELAVQATAPPSGDVWLHELKYDGYRIQAACDGADVRLLTRSGLDWTHRMPSIAAALAKLKIAGAVLDGEVVVLNDRGQTDFAALQAAFEHTTNSPLLYYVFDALRAQGQDLRPLPLLERKQRLKKMLNAAPPATVRFSDHAVGTGTEMFEEACRLGAEGIVSKRGDSAYRSGRQPDWIKIKCYRRQELVIAGFTLPTHNDRGIGALLLGYYENGQLIHAGRTGTGFTAASGQKLRQRLDKLKSDAMPFKQISTAARKGAIWVRPELVCEVSFATWTADGSVRQASFQGLREDKPAIEVRREEAVPVGNVTEDAQINSKPTTPPESATSRTSQPLARKAQQGIRLTHPDKVVDAETKLTKQQLADYLAAVSAVMLPHVVDRPSSLLRCPEGTGHPCFYQKHTSKGMPDGLSAVQIPDRKGGPAEEYVTVETAAGLVGTAQMGALEIHPWGSSNASLEMPDRLIFDLDPDPALPWKVVTGAAVQVCKLLQKYGLASFVKLSGGKGLHIVAPIEPQHEWPDIKLFCRRVAEELESSNRDLYLIKMTKAARISRIFIDYLRNERGSTAIAPWCARARAGMPVAVPLTWNELGDSETMPQFRVADFSKWQQRVHQDPWKKMHSVKQQLDLDFLKAATAGKSAEGAPGRAASPKKQQAKPAAR